MAAEHVDQITTLETRLRDTLPLLTTTADFSATDPVLMTPPENLQETCWALKTTAELEFTMLHCLSAVDYEDELELVYHLISFDEKWNIARKLVLKTRVPSHDPRVSTVMTIWRGADWYEREAADLFGIVFTGHPNLAPLILYDDFDGYPGRRSYGLAEHTYPSSESNLVEEDDNGNSRE